MSAGAPVASTGRPACSVASGLACAADPDSGATDMAVYSSVRFTFKGAAFPNAPRRKLRRRRLRRQVLKAMSIPRVDSTMLMVTLS